MQLRVLLGQTLVWLESLTASKLGRSRSNVARVKGKQMGSTTLHKRDWTLLAIALAGGKSLSPVQLQKSVFLFGEQLTNIVPENFYNFGPYNYGPFCRDVYKDAEALAQEGFLTISTATPYGYSEYSATPEGVARGNEVAEALPDEVVAHAREIVDWVRQQSFRGLVSAIYERYPNYKANSVFTG